MKRINAEFLGICPPCCSLSPPQMVCTTCAHQEALQEQGVLTSSGIHGLLPLRAFGERICWDASCSLFGRGGSAGRKISHLQFACDVALGAPCPSLTCFAPHLPEGTRGVSPPSGQVRVSCCTHQPRGDAPFPHPLPFPCGLPGLSCRLTCRSFRAAMGGDQGQE